MITPGRSIGLVLAILTLNLIDIYNTLAVIGRGGVEVNPIMDYFLGHGVVEFIVVKLFLTTGGLIILLRYKPSFLKYILGLYLVLVVYQFIMLEMHSISS